MKIKWSDARVANDRCATRLIAVVLQYKLHVYGTIKFSAILEEEGEPQNLEKINRFDTAEEAQNWGEKKLEAMLRHDLSTYIDRISKIKEILNEKM